MNEPRWIGRQIVLLLHLESLAEHGGSSGMRDEGLLESALARPRNQYAYEPESDIPQLAAAYGFGLAKNHPFVDDNKRIAFITATLFLRLNGYRLTSDRLSEIKTMLDVASGQLSEEGFALWIRLNSVRRH